jgi:hypothetical protein
LIGTNPTKRARTGSLLLQPILLTILPVSGLLAALSIAGCGASVGRSSVPGASSLAQPAVVETAPVAGYLWSNGDQTLRPILGIPGASQLGASLVPAGEYVAGAASPVTRAALLIDSSGSLNALQLPSGAPSILSTGYSGAAQVRFAPAGTAAVVFSPAAASLLVITGLPSAPVTRTLPASPALVDAAIGDTGTVLTAATTAAGVTIAVAPGGKALTTVSKFGGLAFVPGADSAVVVDNAAHSVRLWTAISAAPTQVAFPAPAIQDAVGAGISRDGRWAVVANGGDTNVVRVDLTGLAAPSASPCLCQPSGVDALAGNAVFRVSQPAASAAPASALTPAWTVDASPAQPRLLFIPAPRPEAK